MGEETEAPSLGLSDEVMSIPIWGGFGGGGAEWTQGWGHGAITAKNSFRGLKGKLQGAGFEERKQNKAWGAAGNRSRWMSLPWAAHPAPSDPVMEQNKLHSCSLPIPPLLLAMPCR